MCGIFGIYEFKNSTVKSNELKYLCNKMRHRGPDDEGFYLYKNLGIGMARLSILDIKNGNQPISSPDKKVHIVYNGEIYNFKLLRKELEDKGHTFNTNTDTEVLLNLYLEFGRKCVDKLSGMFAFCILDQRENKIWIARDRLGIKPLYYSTNNNKFIFSSELSGVASLTDSSLSYQAIFNYLSFSYIPAPQTIYENIYKLEPAEEIILDLKNFFITKQKYWKLEKNSKVKNHDSHQEKIDKILINSVKTNLISDVPVGIFLSGGIDSSLIAKIASQFSKGKVNTFTINFENKETKDHLFARRISKEINSNHSEIIINSQMQLKALQDILHFMDEPLSDSAVIPTYLISKSAKERGIKVLLSGAGADEIFGGYQRHYPRRIWSTAWLSHIPLIFRLPLSYFLGIFNKSHFYRFQNSSRNFASNISGLNFSFIKEILKEKKNFNYCLNKIDNNFNESKYKNSFSSMKLDLNDYLPNNILALTDQATMASSVEGRVPFLDHKIIENSFSMSEKIFFSSKENKFFLKKIAMKYLPSYILNRKKEGFNAPINKWIEDWSDEIESELVNNFSKKLDEILNKEIIMNWLRNKKKKKQAAVSLYSLYILNKWIRLKYVGR